MDFKELEGKEVIGGQGRVLGKVCSIEIDTNTWKIVQVCLDVDKNAAEDLGLERRRLGSVKVTFPPEAITAISDRIILNQSVEQLRTIFKPRT